MDHVMNDYEAALGGASAALETVGSRVPRPTDEAAALSALWTELTRGSCKVEQVTFTPQSYGIVVIREPRSAAAERPALSARDVEILERALTEGVRKSVAVDFGLCPSSVAEILRRSFGFMGLSCWPSRIPLLLVLAAHASRALGLNASAKLMLLQNQQLPRQTLSVTRCDADWSRALSPAEYEVTRWLIEGRSYEQIAALRETSKRTVANQLAAAFQRLHVSGRAELLCSISRGQLADWQSLAALRRPRAHAAFELPAAFARIAGDRSHS